MVRDSKEDFNRWIFYTYLTLLVLLPISDAGGILATSIVEIWIFTSAITWLLLLAAGRVKLSASIYKSWPIVASFIVAVLWTHLQGARLPQSFLGWLSPAALEIHDVTHSPLTLSLDLQATSEQTLRSGAFVVLFCLSLVLLASTRQIMSLFTVLVASGVFQASFGLTMVATGLEYGLFEPKQSHHGVVTGTFADPDQLAGYLCACISIALGLLFSTKSTARGSVNDYILSSKITQPTTWLVVALAVMMTALVLTHSLVANVALFVGLAISLIVYSIRIQGATYRSVLTIAIVLGIQIIGTLAHGEPLWDRLVSAVEDGTRHAKVALSVIDDFPLTGSGAGSYAAMSATYHSIKPTSDSIVNPVSDYLRIMAGSGPLILILLGFALCQSLWVGAKSMDPSTHKLESGLWLGATMTLMITLVQSAFGSYLQLNAIAGTLMIALAIQWSLARIVRQHQHIPSRASPLALRRRIPSNLPPR